MNTSQNTPWLRVAIAALCAAFVLGLFPGKTSALWWWATLDSGHAPFFAILAISCYRAVAENSRSRRLRVGVVLGLVGVGLIALGGGIELLQARVGRDASWGDLTRDAIGVAAGLMFARTFASRRPAARWIFAFGLLLLLATSASPFWWAAQSYHVRDTLFPVLFEPDQLELEPFVRLRETELDWESGMLHFRPVSYPAFILREPRRDWSGYDRVVIDLEVGATAPAKFWIRVDDARVDGRFADRFQRAFATRAGLRAVEIPLSEIAAAPEDRELDLTQISSLSLFLDHPPSAKDLRLRRIRLE